MQPHNTLTNQTYVSESTFKDLFSQIPAPIAIYTGPHLACTFVNEAHIHLSGNSAIINKTIREAYPQLDDQIIHQVFQVVYQKGDRLYAGEIRVLINVDDTGKVGTRYYNLLFTPYRNNAGKIVGVIATANEVIEPVQAKKNVEVEHSLRRELEKFQLDQQAYSLFMQAPVGICILNGTDFTIELANEAILRIWGKGQQAVGMPVLEALPEIEGQGFVELLMHVRESGQPYYAYENVMYFVRNEREELVYADFIYQPYYGEEGQRTGVLLIVTDVTEKVKARRKVEETEHKFRNVIEQATVPMLIFKGEDMVLEVANQALLNLWNVGPEAIGKPFLEILPEMKDQVFDQLLRDVYQNGVTHYGYEEPVTFHRRSGEREVVYCNFVYQPYKESNGRITGVIVLATDVTGQVKAKQKLAVSEIRTRLAVDAARLGTYELNLLNEDFIYTPRQAEIFGLDPSVQWPFKVFKDSVHPDDVHIRLEAHERAKQTGEVFYEVRIIRPDGAIRWIRLNGNYKFENGIPVASFGTTMDITDEKKAAEMLEQKIKERTQELQRANESLAYSNQQLEQFAHVASHDMKEPIRKIMVYTNLIKEDKENVLTDKSKNHLQKVESATERLIKMVEGVLDFSSMNALESHVEKIDVTGIIKNIETDLEILIHQKKAGIHYSELPVIEGVPFLIYQLFYNLINNSLKFAAANRTPEIEIICRRLEPGDNKDLPLQEEKQYFQIEVKDNGIGFQQEYAENIFKTFTRLHSRSEYEGTGLGLALCKNIVTRHQGFIWATSEKDKGSSFVIVLPEQL